MKSVVLGKTGIKVKRLGFGGIPIQRVGQSQAVETVLHAIERGVDFIDTSRLYTVSESLIGKALTMTDRKVAVATKSMSTTADGIRKDIELSLTDLKLDFIDLYQCHYVKDEDAYRKIVSTGGALSGLLKAKQEGLIGHMGITTHSLDLLERVLDDDIFETIMVCFSFLEPKAKEKVIPKAAGKGVGVIAMKPFSGGVIDNPNLALKYVLSQPGVVVIPGVESKALVDQNWAVFSGGYALSSAELKEIEAIRARYAKSFCRRCNYCQPCSEEIPIETIMGMRFAWKRFGDAFLQTQWVKKGLQKAQNCTECGECLPRCPYELPIPDLIKENLEWVAENFPSE